MAARLLMGLSALLVFALGTIHLIYTFTTRKFHPRTPGLREQMEVAPLGITSETTLWRAWIGFNASHSLGAMLFGLVYAHLAWSHPQVLFHSGVLLTLGAAFLLALLGLAHRYWFRVPFLGVLLSLGGFVAALLLR